MSKTVLRVVLVALVSCLACGASFAGVVAYYPFDEGGGTTVNDASGNGNTLTFNGTPTWQATGAFGGSVYVDGQGALARAGGVNPGTIANFQAVTGNKASVTFWARAATESRGSNPFYIGDSAGGQGNRILASHLEWSNGIIYWDVDWGDGSNQRLDQAGGNTADQLHHYAMTYNGDNGRISIYKDGAVLRTATTATDSAIAWNSIRNVEIGAFSFASYWAGELDDMAILNDEMTGAQVSNAKNFGVGNYDPQVEIVPNTVEGRFIRLNKTKPNNVDVPLHVGEVQALSGPATDYALSSKGATATTVYGTNFHGADANLISGGASLGADTWTRDDQGTGGGIYQVEALIDLGQTRRIQSLQVLQRGDGCCQDRLKDFTLTLLSDNGGTPGAVVASQYFGGQAPGVTALALAPGQTVQPGGKGEVGTATVGQTARYVQILNNGGTSRHLAIGELEAFAPGVTPNNNAGPSSNDIAATSFESQVGSGGHGSVNSVLNGALESGASVWTRQGVANSYTMDFGSVAYVNKVRLWQRTDCCYERLENFTVNFLADDGTGQPGGVLASQNYPGRVPNASFADIDFPNAFTVGGADTLWIDIDPAAGTGDLLKVGLLGDGLLNLEPGSTLVLNLLSVPPDLERHTFDILDFGGLTGQFDNILLSAPTGDFTLFMDNLYRTGELSLQVPEPATMALLALSAGGLGGYLRRRRHAA